MAEKKTTILQSDFRKGYYIELNCGMCMYETSFGADTKKELSKQIKDAGWKYLSSDEFGCMGYWCGCDYKIKKIRKNMKRYFIVFYNGQYKTGYSIGYWKVHTENSKYVNEQHLQAEIKDWSKQTDKQFSSVVFTGILELSELDFNEFVREKQNGAI